MIREHISRLGIAPELVLCSSAVRTRETLGLISPALGERVRIEFSEELYEASASTLLELLRELDAGIESAMLVGHNPAIGRLAAGLAASGEQLDEVRRKYPTGALATLVTDSAWSELSPCSARLAGFARPRALEREMAS